MKRNLSDFIRGSQLFQHDAQMFYVGLKWPVIALGIAFCWMTWWQASDALSDHQVYLIWMKFYAHGWALIGLDPGKYVTLESGLGGTFTIPISHVLDFPPVVTAWSTFLGSVRHAALMVFGLGLPLLAAFYWAAVWLGRKAKETRHQRGARLVTTRQLLSQIRKQNRIRQGEELEPTMGKRWILATRRELDALGFYRPIELAGMPYPWREEQTHAMLIGSTGTGKTVAIMDLIDQIRARGQRAIVFDLTGAFISTFYDPERDTILHPLDTRCPAWNIFDECRTAADFTNAAQALVPHDGGGAEQFWVLGARTIFVETCLSLCAEGKTSNEALADGLMRADLSQLHERLKGTLAAPLTAPEAAKLAESVRAVFNVNAQALLYLPTEGPAFSVRDWVSSTQRDGAILFVAARYVDLAICRQLLTLWLDLAVNTLMAMPITRDLKLWFLLDELGALHRLPALEAGLQTARNYGGAFVTGIHTFSKLKETYGDNVANSLSAVAKTKLILGASDPDSATWCSDIIGTGEVQDINEGHSFSANNARDGVSLSPERREKKLVLPDEIRKLNPLHGYICFPGDLPTAPVRLTPVKRPIVAPAFLPRPGLDVRIPKAIRSPTDQSGGTSVPETASANQAGTPQQASAESAEGGRQSDPRQGTLDLPAPKLASATDPGSNASNVEALNRDGPTGPLGPVSGNPGPVTGNIPGATMSVDPSTGHAALALPSDPDADANGGTNPSVTRAPAGPSKSKSARPNSTPGKPVTAQRELLDPPEGPTREPPDLGDFEIDL